MKYLFLISIVILYSCKPNPNPKKEEGEEKKIDYYRINTPFEAKVNGKTDTVFVFEYGIDKKFQKATNLLTETGYVFDDNGNLKTILFTKKATKESIFTNYEINDSSRVSMIDVTYFENKQIKRKEQTELLDYQNNIAFSKFSSFLVIGENFLKQDNDSVYYIYGENKIVKKNTLTTNSGISETRTYDENRNLLKTELFDEYKKKANYIVTFEYDSLNLINKKTIQSLSDDLPKYKAAESYIYQKFDDKGNWIERVVIGDDDKPKNFMRRLIYYK